ncbi:MAG: AAA family ATPase [Bacteroidia bacterium]|nr:MAG: AAA family ATPase [Bacteroidia bacterium]
MQLLPIGIQSFSKLREQERAYVDKTDLIWQLAQDPAYYFLSRPRRFGKSLMLSTLESYFLKQEDLFRGLKLERLQAESGKEWKYYPVIKLSMAGGDGLTVESWTGQVHIQLGMLERRHGVETGPQVLGERFAKLIVSLYEKYNSRVVVLIDEYDSPLLESMGDDQVELHKASRGMLRSMYINLKTYDELVHFAMFTGVSQFSQLSLFSGLNALKIITLENEWSALCGITHEELITYFGGRIDRLAEEKGITREALIAALRQKYDGYLFTPRGVHVYNPYGLLKALENGLLMNYWMQTGSPKVLEYLLPKYRTNAQELAAGVAGEANWIGTQEEPGGKPYPFLFQTGYLTIKEALSDLSFILAFPNGEVRTSLASLMETAVVGYDASDMYPRLTELKQCLYERKVAGFMDRLKPLFAKVFGGNEPRESLVRESHFRNALFVVFTLLGEHIQMEVPSARGRSDCELQTQDTVYIFELKLASSGETKLDALRQIKDQGYGDAYLGGGKPIVCIGATFDSKGDIDWLEREYGEI